MPIKTITDDMRDPGTPPEVDIKSEARKPQVDPTCGIAVAPVAVQGLAKNRLVTIGDSLTHGFQSGAILHTDISWPRIVAWEMGWDRAFRYPTYYDPNGGMPLNVEHLVRKLERNHGDVLDWWEWPGAIVDVLGTLAQLDTWWGDNWKRGMPRNGIMHNLAVWGWDLRDCLDHNAEELRRFIDDDNNAYWRNINAKSAWRVLGSAYEGGKALGVFEAAGALGRQGTTVDPAGPGIETLVVMLGANNALGSVVQLGPPKWSQAGYDTLDGKKRYNVWNPAHFQLELDRVVQKLLAIKAQHVILATVPHVTVAPIAKGVGRDKIAKASRYYEYYCRPWIDSKDFDPREDKHITAAQARAIDSAIDQYNEAIERVVIEQRRAGRDWYLLELSGLLDRLASRRYIEDVDARPTWWDEVGGAYPLPKELLALAPVPDSRFFCSGPSGRLRGGLFSLDGVHPTTIGYGIIAQEVADIMHRAGVQFFYGDDQVHPRPGPVQVDFRRLLLLDSLMSQPPRSLSNGVALLGWLDQRVDNLMRVFGAQVEWP